MKLSRTFVIFVVAITLSIQSCTVIPELGGEKSPSIDNKILFQDDFSDKDSGWKVQHNDNQSIDYEGGGLHFVINQTQYDFWSVPELNFEDVHIEVDATRVDGPEDNDFGIICRCQDEDNFYGFLISSDGYYGITKMSAGEHVVISSENMEFSDKIRLGTETNRIGADCIGSSLRLYVNGELLVEAQDTDYSSGDIGLLAGTFDTPGVDILFDNFVATSP